MPRVDLPETFPPSTTRGQGHTEVLPLLEGPGLPEDGSTERTREFRPSTDNRRSTKARFGTFGLRGRGHRYNSLPVRQVYWKTSETRSEMDYPFSKDEGPTNTLCLQCPLPGPCPSLPSTTKLRQTTIDHYPSLDILSSFGWNPQGPVKSPVPRRRCPSGVWSRGPEQEDLRDGREWLTAPTSPAEDGV